VTSTGIFEEMEKTPNQKVGRL